MYFMIIPNKFQINFAACKSCFLLLVICLLTPGAAEKTGAKRKKTEANSSNPEEIKTEGD